MTDLVCARCGARSMPIASAAGLCAGCLLKSVLSDSGADDFEEPEASVLGAGTMLAAFRIERLLGRGGMAAVYEAYDTRLERAVALKVLPPEFLHEPTFSTRFEREARVVARLEHPNIVQIYENGIDDGTPWMSTRLLAGGNVGALLETGRLAAPRIVAVLADVAKALDYAHARGVVHRDIKPANLLLDADGRVCVADFGLAHMLDTTPGPTRANVLVGTPQYMAPELALGHAADHRADVYSLGIVAYEMFAGAPPFTAVSPVAILFKQVNEPLPVPPASVVSRAVLRAIEQATAKDPLNRFSSASAFVDALAAALHAPSQLRLAPFVAAATLAAIAGGAWAIARGGSDRADPSIPSVPGPPATVFRPAAPAVEFPQQSGVAPPRVQPPSGVPNRVPTGTSDSATAGHAAAPAPLAPSSFGVVTTPAAPQSPVASDAELAPVATAPSRVPAAGLVSTPDILIAPVRLKTVSPEYPDVARAAQIEGDVLVEASVTAAGLVSDVAVLRPVHPLLDEAARKAVLGYEYTPARRNGIPESSRLRITVSFRMK
jgi:TonB family protein